MNDLRTVRFGLVLGLIAILAGFGMGGYFGGFEDDIKGGLRDAALAVLDEQYDGDEAEAKAVYDKAWSYHKRAHMHWGGIGAAALAIGVVVGLVGAGKAGAALTTVLGVGACLYPLCWLLAGRAAPALGGTSAGKAQYELLFQLSSACVILGALGCAIVVATRLFGAPRA